MPDNQVEKPSNQRTPHNLFNPHNQVNTPNQSSPAAEPRLPNQAQITEIPAHYSNLHHSQTQLLKSPSANQFIKQHLTNKTQHTSPTK